MNNKRLYGILPDGSKSHIYTIRSSAMIARVIDFGCVLTNLYVRDRHGKMIDVVLGYKNLENYLVNSGNLGATIAPNANRTKNARFMIDDQVYQLEVNNGPNNLHSSVLHGAQKRLWSLVELKENSVTLKLDLADGENGFPGQRQLWVTYSIEEQTTLQIRYEFISDQKTAFNPTNHTYFNLGGHASGNVLKHRLQLHCHYYTPVAAGSIPTGEIAPVRGTPMDFTEMKTVGRDLSCEFDQFAITGGYDHNFVIDDYDGQMRECAVLECERTGIRMRTFTDLPGVQFYSANYLHFPNGKRNVFYDYRNAVCLETQYFPDSLNQPNFQKPVVDANKKVQTVTRYQFELI